MERRMRANAQRGGSGAGSVDSSVASSTLGSTIGSMYSDDSRLSSNAPSLFEGIVGSREGPPLPLLRPKSSGAGGGAHGADEGTPTGAGADRRGNPVHPRPATPPVGGGRLGQAVWSWAQLAVSVLMWYTLTVLYSLYNSSVLRAFPFPLTVLAAELGAGVLLILPAWVTGVIRTPSLRMSQMPMIFYVSLWHSLSNASTGAALRYSSLAAVTAIQGLEPLASAAVDRFMGRETSHVSVNLCLLPVIGGVLLVGREASLTWGGLFFAVASSAAMGVRDLYSKRASRQKEFNKRPLSAANTYAVVTVMSFATVVPYTFIFDGPRAIRWWGNMSLGSDVSGGLTTVGRHSVGGFEAGWTGVAASSTVHPASVLLSHLAISGILLFLHSAAAFIVLERMGSVTAFSVANSVKRGVVIMAGAAMITAPLGAWTIVGAVLVVLGACAYWVARMYYPPRRRRKGNLQQQ